MRRGSPIPLAADGSGRFLPWLIALMAFLAILSTGAAFAVQGALDRWDRGLTATLTVELPAPADAPMPAERVDAVLAALRATPGITAATPLDRAAAEHLLQPWFGRVVDMSDLPLPTLIDVHLMPNAVLDRDALEVKLDAIVPGSSVERRGAWLEAVFRVARLIEASAVIMVVLVGGVAIAAVIFTTRTGLALHADIIRLLHLIGATDRFIAGQFQWHAFRLALGGGLVGLLMSLMVYGGLRVALEQVQVIDLAGPTNGLRLPIIALAAVICLPLLMALVGLVTARITVLRTLARMP
jgi:cell division transport system permease protein